MSPPLPITEDTPPDMLAGSMDLRVVLPGGHNVKMSVERSTPMMDLLVQVTTANKISPGGHVIQALGERGVLPYKPSTPIGALDTWTIHIVPKNQMSQSSNKKAPLKPVNQPFEQTFRLQVHLPRNQLYVARVSPKAVLSDILMQVCSEKNLDPSRYSLRHPNNLDQVLNLSCTLADYKLQEVTLVYNRSLPVEVSTVDIMALQRDTANSAYNNFTLPRNNRSCDGSVSSGSLGGRSLSPVHSDESSASPPPPPPSRPIRKRRPAPKPPTINDKQMNGGDKIQVNDNQTVGQTTTVICHSRNSSDSSGYHEASVLSESPQSNSLPDSLPRRSKLPSVSTSELTQSTCEVSNNLSRSLSNLTAVGNTVQQTNMRQYNHSTSATSLTTIGGRKKKAAPPPPPVAAAKMSSVNEEDQKHQQRTASVSSMTSSTTTLSGSDSNGTRKSATLPRLSSMSSSSMSSNPEQSTPIQTVPLSPSVTVDTVGSVVESPAQQPVDSIPAPKPRPRSIITVDRTIAAVRDEDAASSSDISKTSASSSTAGTKMAKSTKQYKAPLPKPRNMLKQTKSLENIITEPKSPVEHLHRFVSAPDEMEMPKSTETENADVFVENRHSEEINKTVELIKEESIKSNEPVTSDKNINVEQKETNSETVISKEEDKLEESVVQEAKENPKELIDQNELKEITAVSESENSTELIIPKKQIDSFTSIEKSHKACIKELAKKFGKTKDPESKKLEDSEDASTSSDDTITNSQENIDSMSVTSSASFLAYKSERSTEKMLKATVSDQDLLAKKESVISIKSGFERNFSVACIEDANNILATSEIGGQLDRWRNVECLTGSVIDNRQSEVEKNNTTTAWVLGSQPGSLVDSINGDNSELRMADEEIDRIFHNATRDHTSLESGMGEEPPLSLSSLPSPPASLTQKDLDQSSLNPDPMDWEYKLPAPPTFRDETSSPTVTQFDTITIESESIREQRYQAEETTSWQNGRDSETSGLQSLQVLRSILPQLSQSQSTVNLAETTTATTFEQERVASNSSLKFERKLLEESERDHVAKLKFERTHSEDLVDHEVTKRKLFERSHSVDQEASEKPVKYVYSGPPTINLSTWNERPKRQVSIKNDQDYVFGVGKRSADEPMTVMTSTPLPPSIPEVKEKEMLKQTEQPPANITMRLVSKNNTVKVEAARPRSVDLSHVPIVRAVELKKPYAGSNMVAGFLPTGKSYENITRTDEKYNKVEVNKTTQVDTTSFTGVNSIAKKFGQSASSTSSSKPRPVSCYLFGTETPVTKQVDENKEKKIAGTSKVLLNSSTITSSSGGGKKFTSIVGINGPETKVEIKTANEKLSSKIMINEEKKMKNGVLPNKIEYKSSDVRALSKLSSGGFVDPDSPVDSSKVHPLSSQRRHSSSSSTSSTPRTPNDFSSPTVVSLKTQPDFLTDSSKALSSNNNNTISRIISSSSTSSSPSPSSVDKTNVFFGSNTIERSVNVRPSNFPLPVVKGFRSVSTDNGTESSGGIPPPPPIMPVLKSTSTSRRPVKQLPPPEADPRDKLLESIRAFGKDSLRKVAK